MPTAASFARPAATAAVASSSSWRAKARRASACAGLSAIGCDGGCRVLRGQRCEALRRRRDALRGRRGLGLHALELRGGVALERAERVEPVGLLVEQRVGLAREPDDAAVPGASLLVGVGLGVVEPLLQRERLGDLGLRAVERGAEVGGRLLAVGCHGEAELLLARLHGVVGLHEGAARLSTQVVDRGQWRSARRTAAAAGLLAPAAREHDRDDRDDHGPDDEEPDPAPAAAAPASAAADRVGRGDRGTGPVLVSQLRLDDVLADPCDIRVGQRRLGVGREVVGAPVDRDGEEVVLRAHVVGDRGVVGPGIGCLGIRELVDVRDEELPAARIGRPIDGGLDLIELVAERADRVDDGARTELHRILGPRGRYGADREHRPRDDPQNCGLATYRRHAPVPFPCPSGPSRVYGGVGCRVHGLGVDPR